MADKDGVNALTQSNNQEKSDKKTVLSGQTASNRIQIFAAKSDGGVSSIASLNPSQATKAFPQKKETRAEDKSAKVTDEDDRLAANPRQSAPENVQEDNFDNILELNPINKHNSRRVKDNYRLLNIGATAFTVLWAGFCLINLLFGGGLAQIAGASFMEIGGALGVMLMPVALLWTSLSAIQRKNDVAGYAESLKSELHSILFPSEERAQRVHKDIEALVTQSAQLAASSKAVLKSIHRARHGLRTEMREFTTLAKKGEYHISNLSAELTEGIEQADKLVANLEERMLKIKTAAGSSLENWEKTIDAFLDKGSNVNKAMEQGAEKIVTASKKVSSEALIIQDGFAETAKHITDQIGSASEKLETISGSLDSGFERVTDSAARLDAARGDFEDSAENIAKILTEKSDHINSNFSNFNNGLENNINKLDESFSVFDAKARQNNEAFGDRLSEFFMTADFIADSFAAFENKVDDKAASLTKSVAGLDVFVEKIETTGEDVVHKLSEVAASALRSTETMRGSIVSVSQLISDSTEQAEGRVETLLEITSAERKKLSEHEKTLLENMERYKGVIDTSLSAFEVAQERTEGLVIQLGDRCREGARSLDESAAMLSSTLGSIETKINAPLDQIGKTIGTIAKAEENLELVLTAKTDQLIAANDKTVSAAQKVKDILRGEAEEIVMLTGKITGQSQTVSDTLAEQKTQLQSVITDSLSSLEKVTGSLKLSSEEAQTSAAETRQSFETIHQAVLKTFDTIQTSQTTILADFEVAEQNFSNKASSIEKFANQAIEKFTHLYSDLKETTENIRPLYDGFLEDSATLEERMKMTAQLAESQFEGVVDRLLGTKESLTSTVSDLSQQAEKAEADLARVNAQLNDNKNMVTLAAEDARSAADKTLRGFEDTASDIHLAVDQASLKIEAMQKLLGEQVLTLSDFAGQSVASLESAGRGFEDMAGKLQDNLEEAKSGFGGLKSIITQETKELIEVSDLVTRKTKDNSADISSAQKALLTCSDETLSSLRQISDSISIRTDEITKNLKAAENSSESYSLKLQEALTGIQGQSNKTVTLLTASISDLKSSGQDIAMLGDQLNTRIAEAGDGLKNHARDLKTVSEAASAVTQEAGKSFSQHTENLKKVSDSAMDHIKKIRESAINFQRDAFLGSAKFMMESVHSLSVDIIRHIKGGDVDEKDMRAYEKGELTLFTQKLVELGERFPNASVREKFSSDSEFRTYVQRYCRQFEELVEKAAENDHGGIMTSTFMASDIGKVYLLICKAIGRTPRGITTH